MRRILALGVAALAVLGLSACTVGGTTSSGGGSSGGAKHEISFLTFETPNLTPQYWDAAIKRVTDKYPDISVKKLVSPTQDRTNYAKQLLASGQFPDVMIAVSPAGFAESGNLYAWTPDELKDFAYPSNGAISGKVYQLPANTQTIPVVYYNKDLFAKAGISAPPKTYAELLADAAKLKAKGITPFVVGGVHDSLGPTWAAILATEVYAKNPNWMHDRRAGKVKFSDPDFTRGAAKLAELAQKGYIDKRDVSRDYAATQQAFLDGEGAMYVMGNWFAAAVDDPKTKPSWQVGQFEWPSDDGKMVVPASPAAASWSAPSPRTSTRRSDSRWPSSSTRPTSTTQPKLTGCTRRSRATPRRPTPARPTRRDTRCSSRARPPTPSSRRSASRPATTACFPAWSRSGTRQRST